jgi:prevent-host-death family protein
MSVEISVTELRRGLARVVESVRRGSEYTVVYRRRAAFRIVPLAASPARKRIGPLEDDPLYRAPAVGRSRHRAR